MITFHCIFMQSEYTQVVASQKGLPSEAGHCATHRTSFSRVSQVWIAGNRGQAEEVQLLLKHAADEASLELVLFLG